MSVPLVIILHIDSEIYFQQIVLKIICYELKKGLILTYDDDEEIIKDGLKIKVIPGWK